MATTTPSPSSDLRDTPARALVENKKKVIFVSPTTSLKDTLSIMKKYNISAIPVFSETEGWIGFINVFDVMAYVAFFTYLKEEGVENKPTSFVNLESPISTLIPISTETASQLWVAYSQEETLGSIASRLSSGIHRMLLAVDDEARLLTQTDVVKYLLETDTTDIKDKTLEQLGLAQVKSVASINQSSTAIGGFRTIYKEHVSAVAILDDNHTLVATLSSSDVRVISEADLSDLVLPVLTFLDKHNLRRPPLSVTKDTTLGNAMTTILNGKVHRAWICTSLNDHQVLQGVLTFSDIIRLWYK